MEKYFTKDEYLKEMGIDLEIELQDDDDASNKVERFIKRRTDECAEKLALHYANNMDLLNNWDKIPEMRQKWFVKGCMEQVAYILRNGLISLDSGYDPATRTIIDLGNIALGSRAKECFKLGGFLNILTGGRFGY